MIGAIAAVLVLAGAALWLRRTSHCANSEVCAVILAALCQELRAAPEELRIVSIRKL